MSSRNVIEVHVEPATQFQNMDGLGEKLAALNYFESEEAGPAYQGFALFDGKYLVFYEADDGQDTYGTRLRSYGEAGEFAKAIAEHLVAGQVTLLDLPEGNPASVLVITPGQVNVLIDGSKANWNWG